MPEKQFLKSYAAVVINSSGFIGRAVVEALLAQNQQVAVIGIVAVLLHGRPDEYNPGSSEGLSNRQALAPLATETGHPIRSKMLPLRPFDVPANVLDCTKLRTKTGWQSQLTFMQALAHTWAWYVRQPPAVPTLS